MTIIKLCKPEEDERPGVYVWLTGWSASPCIYAQAPDGRSQIIARIHTDPLRLELIPVADPKLLSLMGDPGSHCLEAWRHGEKLSVENKRQLGPVGSRILSDEQVHAIEDAAAKRALEYAARRMDEFSKTTSGARVDHASVMIRAMTEGVWCFRADSQGKEPEA